MALSKENWLAVFAAIAYTESRMPRVYTGTPGAPLDSGSGVAFRGHKLTVLAGRA
jgi:hypothetical protein